MNIPAAASSSKGRCLPALCLLIGGFCMQIGWIFVPTDSLPHRPFEEDTFFHLTACRNLAEGKGITIEGRPTSGAQFGTLIYALAYRLAPGSEDSLHLRLVRLIALGGSVFSAVCVGFFSWALCRGSVPKAWTTALLSAAIWSSSFQAFRINMNGYETVFATSFFLLSASLFVFRWEAPESLRTTVWLDFLFGVTLGACILARVDLGIWAISAAGVFFCGHRETLHRKIAAILIWAATALVVSLPFWLHNLSVSGSVMPISGNASAHQMSFHGYGESIGRCFLRVFTSLGEFPLLSFYSPYPWGDQWQGAATALAGFALLLMACRALPQTNFTTKRFPIGPFTAVAICCFLLVLYYVFAHGSWWFIKRYLHPIRGVFFSLTGLYVFALTMSLPVNKSPFLQKRALPVLLAGFFLLSVAQYAVTYGDTTSNRFLPTAKWINAHLPAEAKKGAFQSGTLGYFCRNVSNLDGKNNPEALLAIINGGLMDYINKEDFEYIVDWPSQVAKYLDMALFLKFYEPIQQVGPSVIYRKRVVP
jgi:hypothetical protein